MKNRLKTGIAAASAVVCLSFASSCGDKQTADVVHSYETLTLERTSRTFDSYYAATLKGCQDVEIRPQVSGTIVKICIGEGAVVRKGQALFIIDQVPYEAALQTAEANVEVARANVATAEITARSKEELYRKNIVSAYEYQTSRNTLQSRRAELELAEAQEVSARNNLSYTVVKSPVDGIAGMIAYRVGALVGPEITEPLTRVSDNKSMHAYFSMTENQVLALRRDGTSLDSLLYGMPDVRLRMSDGTLYSEKGRIDAISGVIDPSTGAISVRATFPNEKYILTSGGSGTVVYPYELHDVIVIPQSATYEVQDKVYVWKVVDGKAVSTLIGVMEVSNGQEYIVTEGLAEGEQIVTEGVGMLEEGCRLE